MVNWLDGRNPQAGGAEIHLHEVFGRLARRGHGVTLLCSGFPGGASREWVDGLDVHRIGGRMSFGLKLPLYLRTGADPEEYDVVVEDLNKVPVFMPFWTRRPVVLLVHHLFGATAFREASIPLAAATWLLERPVPRVFAQAPVVAVSQSTAEDLRERGMKEAEIAVVPNGVELDRFRPLEGGSRYPEPTILYLGRLKRYKGVDLILRAAARLKSRIPGLRLLVAGKGDHLPHLRALQDRLGLGDVASFLGYVSEEKKIELFQKSWVHVLTSPKEGWGISILEAAACGTPSVASRSPGLQDAVLDGKTGDLVPHGNVEALAGALGRLLTSHGIREDQGRWARRFAEKFSWDHSATTMEEFLLHRVAGGLRGP